MRGQPIGEPKNLSDLPAKQTFFIGLGFFSLGVLLELRAFDVITIGELTAPPWVLSLVGALIVMVGPLSWYYSFRAYLNKGKLRNEGADLDIPGWLFTCIFLTSFAILGGWISLKGDDRGLSGGFTGSPMEVRIGFGVVSMLCGIGAFYLWRYGFRAIRTRKMKRAAPTGVQKPLNPTRSSDEFPT